MIIKCVVCEKEFEDYHNPPRKFCSRECYGWSRLGKSRPQMRKREILNCVICGKQFETGGRAGKRKLYCSRTCQAIARVRVAKVNQMSVTDAAYLAGLIDGEGSVVAAKKRQRRTTWRLVVSNTDFDLLKWCKDTTGCGSIVTHKHDNPKWSDSGSWQCYSWNARDILNQILPYMKIGEKIRRANQMIAELGAINDGIFQGGVLLASEKFEIDEKGAENERNLIK